MRKAFTLIEVNLAMLIMATGILTIVGLYAFGYRESRQSREDVAATALADTIVSQVVSVLGSSDLKWSVFKDIPNIPEEGWTEYFDENTGLVKDDPTNRARSVFSQIMSQAKSAGVNSTVDLSLPQAAIDKAGMMWGLVITHKKGSPLVGVAFRATKQPGTLLAMPLYYCEVRFQGDPNS